MSADVEDLLSALTSEEGPANLAIDTILRVMQEARRLLPSSSDRAVLEAILMTLRETLDDSQLLLVATYAVARLAKCEVPRAE